MIRFRSLFTIYNILLVASAFLFTVGTYSLTHTFGNLSSLVFHKGIIQNKRLALGYYRRNKASGRTDTILVFRFIINDSPKEYNVSWLPKAMNSLLETGDTVVFYTKPVTSVFGNEVSNGLGRQTKSHSNNEVFHLVCSRYELPLVNFDEYNKSLRTGAYAFLILSLLFAAFGYFFKRYG